MSEADAVINMQKKIKALTAENKDLKAALEKYGQHTEECLIAEVDPDMTDNCICGLNDLLEALEQEAKGSCNWEQGDEHGFDPTDTWETDCGNYYTIFEGTPAENHMKFCCFCGKPLIEKPFVPEQEDE